MERRSTIISPEIEWVNDHPSFELQLDNSGMIALQKIKGFFTSKDEPIMVSLVKHGEEFKVISCRKFKGKDSDDSSFFTENYLSDYLSYLDYLYLRDVLFVDEMPITLEDFEVILKAIICCYDVEMDKDEWQNLVKITDKANDNVILYSTDYTRPTFDIELLSKVRYAIREKFKTARNIPSVEEVAKLLKKNPRPSMIINSSN